MRSIVVFITPFSEDREMYMYLFGSETQVFQFWRISITFKDG